MKLSTRIAAISASLLLIAPLAGCASQNTEVSGQVLVQWIDGTLGLEGAKGHGGMDCYTRGGYSDIEEGADVVVLNGDGKALAKGTLAKGETSEEDNHVCVFTFAVKDVPLDGDLFTIQVAHRDGPMLDRDELSKPHTLSLLDG